MSSSRHKLEWSAETGLFGWRTVPSGSVTYSSISAKVMQIRQDIEREGIFIEYRVVLPFVLEAVYLLDLGKESAVAATALATVERIIGPLECTPVATLRSKKLNDILEGVHTALKGVMATVKKFEGDAKDEYISDALDVDTCRVHWMMQGRHTEAREKHKERVAVEMVGEIIAALDKLSITWLKTGLKWWESLAVTEATW